MKRMLLAIFILWPILCYYTYQVNKTRMKLNILKYSPKNKEIRTSNIYQPSKQQNTINKQDISFPTITNKEFITKGLLERNFNINDPQQIIYIQTPMCYPQLFGYPQQMGKKIWPDFEYPKCQLQVDKATLAQIKLDSKRNVQIECKTGTPSYIKQPQQSIQTLLTLPEMRSIWKQQVYSSSFNLESLQFLYAKCDENPYHSAFYHPIFNQASYLQAKSITKTHQNFQKPLHILILTVDSFSRKHFFRKLPKTILYLNSLQELVVFDFKIHNIFGNDSIKNMIPVLGNQTIQKIEYYPGDILSEGALWNIFKKSGYMTLIGFENCDYNFAQAIGRRPKADHLLRNFYCGASEFLGVQMKKSFAFKQRCIGPHMSHQYALNYTYEFAQMYFDVNQLIYLHLNAAHQETGQHANTLDDDLLIFLQKYIDQIGKNANLAIFLHGDHGMRYGNWERDVHAYQQQKLPAFFLLVSKEILEKIQYSYDTLTHNTKFLTSKVDMRPTILSLMDFPYNKGFKRQNDVYSLKFKNLFTQKVHPDRNCESIGIPPIHCSCQKYYQIDLENPPSKEYFGLIKYLVLSSIDFINEKTLRLNSKNQICTRLSLRQITKVMGFTISNVMETVLFRFTVNQSKKAQFQAVFIFGSPASDRYTDYQGDLFFTYPYLYNFTRIKVRPYSITRKDSYSGPCQVRSRVAGINAEFCVCN